MSEVRMRLSDIDKAIDLLRSATAMKTAEDLRILVAVVRAALKWKVAGADTVETLKAIEGLEASLEGIIE